MASERILRVNRIWFQIQKSNPIKYQLFAGGTASSGGWKNGHLAPWAYIPAGRLPDDGIQDFDFVADRPKEAGTGGLTDIPSDPLQWQHAKGLNGFRVHAAENSMSQTWATHDLHGHSTDLDTGFSTQLSEDRALTVLMGTVQQAGISYCMDGATHLLLYGLGAMRLRARTPETQAAFSKAEGTPKRVIVAGYPAWGAECMHLSVYQVLDAPQPISLTGDRFVPFPWRITHTPETK
jgi:hypothetical protein